MMRACMSKFTDYIDGFADKTLKPAKDELMIKGWRGNVRNNCLGEEDCGSYAT